MITVTLYGRAECHLCEQAKADLDGLRAEIPHKLVVVDIDSDPQLVSQYGLEVPVIVAGPFTKKAPFTQEELRVTLKAARDRDRHILRVENSPKLADVRSGGVWTRADSFDLWLSNHYMAMVNLIVLFYVGMAFMAPALTHIGWGSVGIWLYRAYGLTCHQLAYRSFFLYGEQPYYPREVAQVEGVKTYAQATGLSEAGDAAAVFTARAYIGNPTMGYKVALCQRDVAIYLSIFAFGILFSLGRSRFKAIPWWLWLILAIGPIGLDGFSQLFSQEPLNFIPFRESTPFLRVLTGSLFGFMTAWFGYPLVEEGMAETRKYKEEKRQRMFGK
jgi:uncharacterized membrane protein